MTKKADPYKIGGRRTPLVHTINFAVTREQQAYIKQRGAELKLKPAEFMRQLIDNSMATNPTMREAEEQRREQLESNHGWTAHVSRS